MKRPGLTPAILAATLFVALGLRAQTPRTEAALAAVPAPMGEAQGVTSSRINSSPLGADQDSMLNDMLATTAATAPAKPAGGAANPTQAFRQKMLEMFDKNGDGKLDDAERLEARKYAEDRGLGPDGAVRADLIKRFDKDGDGKLNESEIAALKTFLQNRRPPNAANGGAGVAAGVKARQAMAGKAVIAAGGAKVATNANDDMSMSMADTGGTANALKARKAERLEKKAERAEMISEKKTEQASEKTAEEMAKRRTESLEKANQP